MSFCMMGFISYSHFSGAGKYKVRSITDFIDAFRMAAVQGAYNEIKLEVLTVKQFFNNKRIVGCSNKSVFAGYLHKASISGPIPKERLAAILNSDSIYQG